MNPNPDPINAPKVQRIVDHLKRIRTDGPLVVGWEEGQVPPTAANHLEKAGLVVITVQVVNGRNHRTVAAVDQA